MDDLIHKKANFCSNCIKLSNHLDYFTDLPINALLSKNSYYWYDECLHVDINNISCSLDLMIY